MSENETMTPEEARDLSDKLAALAGDLSPRQREFLSALLTARAQTSEVQGYGISLELLSHPILSYCSPTVGLACGAEAFSVGGCGHPVEKP